MAEVKELISFVNSSRVALWLWCFLLEESHVLPNILWQLRHVCIYSYSNIIMSQLRYMYIYTYMYVLTSKAKSQSQPHNKSMTFSNDSAAQVINWNFLTGDCAWGLDSCFVFCLFMDKLRDVGLLGFPCYEMQWQVGAIHVALALQHPPRGLHDFTGCIEPRYKSSRVMIII